MLRRMLFMLGAVVVVVAILAALKFNSIYQQIQQFQAPKPAIDVETELPRRMDWQSRLPAIGTLKASQGIDLSVEIAGTITDVQFQSGEKVSKGQAIVLLDSEMEQASLASAEADLNLSRLERSEERRVGKECVRSVDLGGRGIIKKKKKDSTRKVKNKIKKQEKKKTVKKNTGKMQTA